MFEGFCCGGDVGVFVDYLHTPPRSCSVISQGESRCCCPAGTSWRSTARKGESFGEVVKRATVLRFFGDGPHLLRVAVFPRRAVCLAPITAALKIVAVLWVVLTI